MGSQGGFVVFFLRDKISFPYNQICISRGSQGLHTRSVLMSWTFNGLTVLYIIL